MNISEIISKMTLEEKASLCSGADSWHTKAIDRLELGQIMVSDGPHGVRKQQDDENGNKVTVKAVCFPSGAGIAASFDRNVAWNLGHALGEEAGAEGIHTLLGPAINIKRSPLCGRNFEYLSEDPFLAGEMAASYVNAVQEMGVGTSVKHFAANNQEFRRMSVNVHADERTLREIYLSAFETVVKKAKPWTIMCSYNRINGEYSCENEWLLTKVLRDEWRFGGIVMTDWGAMNRRCKALEAGLELEMPSSGGATDKLIVRAVKNGLLDEKVLDNAVSRLLNWIMKQRQKTPPYSKEEHHALAEKLECECAVLLKNENDVLPLKKGSKTSFIGGFARTPRFQGGGSSHINCFKIENALNAVSDIENISFFLGFDTEQVETDISLLDEAVQNAASADCAVIFAGLPDSFESEGFDREHIMLPRCQNELISKVAAVQPNTIVVLHIGAPVAMPWASDVKGIINLYLGGQAVGTAARKLIYGEANPSGKLAETFPLQLEDTPCYLDFPGTKREVNYSEGVFVGYRYYDTKKIPVLFPFGHGLSYTSFEYEKINISKQEISDEDVLEVTVTVKNTGNVYGKEAVQLYVISNGNGERKRPLKELKGFEKIGLQPGEAKDITFRLDKRSFAYYETDINDWLVPSGIYTIMVGTSSAVLPLCADVLFKSKITLPLIIDDSTTCGDILSRCKSPESLKRLLANTRFDQSAEKDSLGAATKTMMNSMFDGLPVHGLRSFAGLTDDDVETILNDLRCQESKN